MGSTIDWIECPNCKQLDCYNEFYYKSGEEYTFCHHCGYADEHFLKRDKEGKVIKNSKGEYKWVHRKLHHPYCAVRVAGDKSGNLSNYGSRKAYEKMKANLANDLLNSPEMFTEVLFIEMSRLYRGKIIYELLYGTKPEEKPVEEVVLPPEIVN